MGIDISGGMIVGEQGNSLSTPEDCDGRLVEWAVNNGLDFVSLYFDADQDNMIFGFTVPDIPVSEIDGNWLADVKEKAEKFKNLTGVNARLIGTQDIW